jgi:hypothetical protein
VSLTEPCEKHDLTGCADCNPRPRVVHPHGNAGLGPWVMARYSGICSGCGGHMAQNDLIRSDGEGGWLGECCSVRNG